MSDHNDELAGIFDHLTPEDFVVETTAIHEMSGKFKGQKQFDAFAEEQLRSLRIGFAAAGGHQNPIGVLASSTVQRVFTPEEDETVGDFLNRLQREARLIGATWLFFAKKTMVGTYEDDEARDITDPVGIQKAIEAGTMQLGLLWYAERRESDEHSSRHGFLTIVDNKITGSQAGEAPQAMEVFAHILGSHKPK